MYQWEAGGWAAHVVSATTSWEKQKLISIVINYVYFNSA